MADTVIFNTYLGKSAALDRPWLVKAYDIDDASRKVIEFCKEELADLDASSDEDVNIDLGFILLDREVMEI